MFSKLKICDNFVGHTEYSQFKMLYYSERKMNRMNEIVIHMCMGCNMLLYNDVWKC